MASPSPDVKANLSIDLIRPPGRVSHFDMDLLEVGEEMIVGMHTASRPEPLVIDGEEVLAEGCTAVWFLFKGRPYDIGRFYRPDGTWTGFYVDVLEPMEWQGADATTVTPLVDLFLDIWIAPDGRHQVLDEDEFEEAVELGCVNDVQAQHARKTVEDLQRGIRERTFPPPEADQFTI